MIRSAVVLVLALAGACSHTTDSTGDNVACVLLGPTIRPSSATLHPGDTLRLAMIYVAPCSSSSPSQSYRWSSSDTTTARVDLVSGLVTARRLGLATITSALAADPNVKSAMLLRVEP